MGIAEMIVLIFAIHAAIGVLFGVGFVLAGVQRVDPQTRDAGLLFRLLILPGVAALWPLFAWKWHLARPSR
jgi:hypothetical protein